MCHPTCCEFYLRCKVIASAHGEHLIEKECRRILQRYDEVPWEGLIGGSVIDQPIFRAEPTQLDNVGASSEPVSSHSFRPSCLKEILVSRICLSHLCRQLKRGGARN